MTEFTDPAGLWMSPVNGHPIPLTPPEAQTAPQATQQATQQAAAAVERDAVAVVRGRVASALADLAQSRRDAGRPLSPEERAAATVELVANELEAYTTAGLHVGRPALSAEAEARVRQAVVDGLLGLGGLQALLDDPRVENIDVIGDRVFLRDADGRVRVAPPVAASDEDLVELIRTIAARSGLEERRFDRAAPRLSIQLPDGSRMFAVAWVTARPCISIRRHRHQRVTLAQLTEFGTLDPTLHQVLAAAVRAKLNLLITGGPAVGKTTLLRALAAEIPPWERIITIEDTLELGLNHDTGAHPNCVAFQAREANVEGVGAVDLAELVRWSLRMSPDRVIVGEVRGAELVPMLNAMSMGTDGSMATLHSSTSRGAFTKLAAYAAQSAERLDLEATNLLVAAAVHLVVHLAWADGVRVVASVREVIDADGPQIISNEVFQPGPHGRAVPGARLRDETADALVAAGMDPGLLTSGRDW